MLTDALTFSEVGHDLAQMHLCPKTVFEVVHKSKDISVVTLKLKISNQIQNSDAEQTKNQVKVDAVFESGKIFINFRLTEIMLALRFTALLS